MHYSKKYHSLKVLTIFSHNFCTFWTGAAKFWIFFQFQGTILSKMSPVGIQRPFKSLFGYIFYFVSTFRSFRICRIQKSRANTICLRWNDGKLSKLFNAFWEYEFKPWKISQIVFILVLNIHLKFWEMDTKRINISWDI